jgi:cell fate regulator YaaT (PSP1 superfamily)
MIHTVKVRLRKPRRVFTFVCNDVDLKRDEACIVQSDRGMEWGTCLLPPEPMPQEMQERYSMRVLRKAGPEDEETHAFLEREEATAKSLCKKKIDERKLPMKLVDVEYTFDKKKVVFYFTADDRVDFRELVRDLAHELRSRIEMRHIQVRDEAKMVGGIGSCGRALCCTTWLNDFKPISMRMAKRQNLALNPSKISGQCGRLLCCLAYENDQYESLKKQQQLKKKQRAEQQEARALREKEEAERQKAREEREQRARERRASRGGGRPDARPKDTAPKPAPEVKAEAPAEKSAEKPVAPPAQETQESRADGDQKKRRRRRRRRRPGGGGGGKSGEGS